MPFACSFACFLVGRFETIRVSVAYTDAPVKLVGTHVGVAIGEDGYTQMGLEDIACLRSLPNIPIIQPADELETRQAVAYAVEHPGPLYLRLTRQNLEPVHDAAYRFQFGKADVLRPGHDVTVLATGGPVWNALEAAQQARGRGHPGRGHQRGHHQAARRGDHPALGGPHRPRGDGGGPQHPRRARAARWPSCSAR